MKKSKKWLVVSLASLLIVPSAVAFGAEDLTDGAAVEKSEEIYDQNEIQEIGIIDDGEDVAEISEEMAAELFSEGDIYSDLEEEPDQVGATSGTCGANLIWKLEGDTLTISGTGEMSNYSYEEEDSPGYYENRKSIKQVIIESGVTSIGDGSFLGCTNLEMVEIPDSVAKIGYDAFGYCTSLTSINIPESVREIGAAVFRSCTMLTTVMLPSSLKSIPNGCFENCTSLINIQIPERVTEIGYRAFSHCTSLKSLNIPDRVTTINSGAFQYCTSLENINLPEGIFIIDEAVFSHCSNLKSITIPNKVYDIYRSSFEECSSLSEVIIPESVRRIMDRAFAHCTALKKVSLSNTEIWESAFEGCSSLSTIVIPSGMSTLSCKVFKDCTNLQSVTLLEEPSFEYGYYHRKGVNKIEESAFEGCTSLKSITLPSTVNEVQEDAFYNCTSLKDITFMGNAPEKWGMYIFGNVSATAYYLQQTKGWTKEVCQGYGGDITWSMKKTDLKSADITGLYNSSNGGDLRWKAVNGADRYIIYRTNAGKTEKIAIVSKDKTTFMDDSISYGCWGKVYVYYVCTGSGAIETPRGTGQTLQRLAPMYIYSWDDTKSKSVTLYWGVTSGSNKANGYELQYATSKTDLFGQKGSFKKVSINGRNNLTKTISGLTKGKTYYFRVRAYVNYTHSVTKKTTKTWSQYSNVISVKITK